MNASILRCVVLYLCTSGKSTALFDSWISDFESPSSITRYDVASASQPNVLAKETFKIDHSRHWSHLTVGIPAKPLADPFVFTLKCDASKEMCIKIEETMKSVSLMIGELVYFNTPVLVNVDYKNFTYAKELIAHASPASYLLARKIGQSQWTIYPSALHKQLIRPSIISLDAKYCINVNADSRKAANSCKEEILIDILINLNNNSNFWFDGDDGIKQNQFDFSITFAHELLHGLGIQSNLELFRTADISHLKPYVMKNTMYLFIVSPDI